MTINTLTKVTDDKGNTYFLEYNNQFGDTYTFFDQELNLLERFIDGLKYSILYNGIQFYGRFVNGLFKQL